MNLYDLHENPEQLYGYSTREYHVPELAFNLLLKDRKLKRVLEPVIMKDPHAAYMHALINGRRWREAEPYIMKEPLWAYMYARDVLKRRWPEAEPVIMKEPTYWKLYSLEFNL